ncbi:hypothetical protein M011DRAFT_91150 [Sporormia fimetaria CBS 119925]|uniref:Peptidase M10 metallopeptidase domain-containing protein n=1 Tax=Sporormia fimetaria CBS 119925 TaxID=1340428 RepID=A0A6A6VAW9_9PLEO|nr:hypothetical protein M011DRAFT_91150 [Sporormia fimetaria CBS 119925]
MKFLTLLSLLPTFTLSLTLPHPAPLPRQTTHQSLKPGAYLLTFTPSSPSKTSIYSGTLRVTSNDTTLHISGDLYNTTTLPSPSTGIPIQPRSNYFSFLRGISYTPLPENDGFTLGLESYPLTGFRAVMRFTDTIWASEPVDGGYTISFSRGTPEEGAGYPDAENYFTGTVTSTTDSKKELGTMTLGYLSPFLRRATLELASVSGVELPVSDISGTKTWKTVFESVGWDMSVAEGDRNVPEPDPANELGKEYWNEDQEHDAMLKHRSPTDFDTEWKIWLLVIRKSSQVTRGAMIDTNLRQNNIPREGTMITSDWVVGTWVDGTPGSRDGVTWPSAVAGKKFVDVKNAWFRTAVHEVGHVLSLTHPYDFMNDVMTDTPSFVTAGEEGWTEKQFPENITPETFRFSEMDTMILQHRPDAHVRPGFVDFGPPTDVSVFGGWKEKCEN